MLYAPWGQFQLISENCNTNSYWALKGSALFSVPYFLFLESNNFFLIAW